MVPFEYGGATMVKRTLDLCKSVNDYLNHYVVVIDSKAAAIGAASLVVVGLVVAPGAIKQVGILGWLGALSAAVSVLCSGAALYPRTPHSNEGHLFWGDIIEFESASSYWESFCALSEDEIEKEYALQNYSVSGVLRRKTALVRTAMWFLGGACLLVALAYGAV